MKIYNIEQFEKLKINSIGLDDFDKIKIYRYHPKTKDELKQIIEERIDKEGNNCDLNCIDVSNVTDMCRMFYNSEFNGDISEWNVSNVEDMNWMFYGSKFNRDISNWNVSNVINMYHMFYDSYFNGNISKWDISKVKTENRFIFEGCPLENNPPKWYKK